MVLRMVLTGTGRKRTAVWHGHSDDPVEPLSTVNDPMTVYALSLIILQQRDEWYAAAWDRVLLEDLGRNRIVWTGQIDQLNTMAPEEVIDWVAEQHRRYTEEVSAR